MPEDHSIVLFDGVCNLCSASMRFIWKRDPVGRFRFAALQSDAARQRLARFSGPQDASTMVVISRNRLFVKSDAALEIVRQLKMPWRLLRVLKVVPRPVRDAIYDLVASRRYAWFGKKDSCMVPPAELRSRFLD